MLASEEIGILNVNNDVGYYASECGGGLFFESIFIDYYIFDGLGYDLIRDKIKHEMTFI